MPIYLRYEPLENTGQQAFWEACGWRRNGGGWYRPPDAPRAPFPGLVGPARIGKTKTGAHANILNAIEFPARYMVLAPTYQNHMLMTTLPEYIDCLERMHKDSLRDTGKPLVKLTADGNVYHKTERTITLDCGSVFFFRSTEEIQNLYGPTVGGYHADEAGLMPEDATTIMQMRMTDAGGAGQGIYTFTPKGSKKHWTNRLFGGQLTKAKEALARGEIGIGAHAMYPVFSLTLQQMVEAKVIPKWLVDEMEKRAEESPLARQEFYGEWADVGGLVYETFDYNIHVRAVPQDRNFVRYTAGVDFGLSAPTVVIVVGEDQNGRYWWCREFHQRHCSDRLLVEACRRFMDEFPGINFYCDPHSPEIIKGLRANMIPARKARADPAARVTFMWDRLARMTDGNPGIYFTPECVNSIAEIESWSWKPTAAPGGVVRYDDLEPHYHCMDAGGQGVVALGRSPQPIPIETRRERALAATH